MYFYRYDFVRRLRGQIENKLGFIIDKEIERLAFSPQHNLDCNATIVKLITNKIMESDQYVHQNYCKMMNIVP